MKNVAVLPPVKATVRAALLSLAAYKDIPTQQLIAAARALPGGTKVHIPDRVIAIALLLGTKSVDLN